MKKVALILCIMLSFELIVYAENNKKCFLNSSFNYNVAEIPNFLNNTFTRWGNPYYIYYKNNISMNIHYSRVKKNILYKVGGAIESFSMVSDTAIGYSSSCGNEIKVTLHGKGRYLCLFSGIEFYPLNKFHFFTIGVDFTIGFSSNASKNVEIIGCFGSDTYESKLFLGSSIYLNGYLPIAEKWDLILNLRSQLRGDHIDFFTHVDYGFGIGCRYKISR